MFLVVGGCAVPDEPPVASVGGAVLWPERLAELMILGQPLAIEEDTGLRLANHWVEMTAVARAVSEGRTLTDSSALDVGDGMGPSGSGAGGSTWPGGCPCLRRPNPRSTVCSE